MKILITGSNGQLGQTLQSTLSDHTLEAHDLPTLDLLDKAAVASKFAQFKPDIVVNAAAYTAVDKAETDVELATAVNVTAAETLASECANHGAHLFHVSTDFVFDGTQSTPYHPDDSCNPINVYGKTKRDGELAILRHLPDRCTIIRTAWLYSAFGNNFVKTMLRLMKERPQLKVVADQVGTPTSAETLAAVIRELIPQKDIAGIYHWTDAGAASWYDFAVAINEEANSLGMLQSPVEILPIPAKDYPTPAQRPAYSVLDKATTYARTSFPITHWRVQLRQVLATLSKQEKDIV